MTADLEKMGSDPLYLALIIRQRLRNSQLIMEHYPASSDGSITLSAAEGDLLLNQFASFAEKASDLAGQLAAEKASMKKVRKAGEYWHREALSSRAFVDRVMQLFKPGEWRGEKQDDQGWMIHSPRVDGMASHTVIWEDSSNPAEALLALLLDEVFPDGKGGAESTTLADALDYLGRNGGDVEL